MSKTSRRTSWLPIFLMVPLTIGATSHVVAPFVASAATYRETFVHVPTLLLVVPLLIMARELLAEDRIRQIPGQGAVVLLALVFTLAMVWGATGGNGFVSVAYWLQTLLPLAAFVLGTWVRLQPLSVARGVIIGGLIPGTLTLVLSVPAGFTGALTRLPQLHNLLPLAIFVGTAFAVAFHDRARNLSFCSMAVSAFLLPGLWSRSSLGFLLLAVGITALLGVGAVPKHKRAAAGLALVWVAMLGVGLAYQATQHGKIGDREATASFSFAAERRQEIYGVAIDRALSSPIVGDAFGTVGNIRLSSGVRADFSTLFPTENQYLDYAIRAGLLAPILLLWILVGTARRGLALARGPDVDSARFGRATVGIVAGTLLVNNFHLFMVQGQSAVILWFVFGYASRLAAIRRDTLSDVGDEAGVDKSGADAPARSNGGDRGRRPGGGGVFR